MFDAVSAGEQKTLSFFLPQILLLSPTLSKDVAPLPSLWSALVDFSQHSTPQSPAVYG